MRYEHARTWADLHPSGVTFTSTTPGTTSTDAPGPAGAATDPISTATLPGPNSYKGCRIMHPSEPDPTVATFEFPITKDLVMMGGPVVDVAFGTTATEVPLGVRVWDVTADGATQGLVTRGNPTGSTVRRGPGSGRDSDPGPGLPVPRRAPSEGRNHRKRLAIPSSQQRRSDGHRLLARHHPPRARSQGPSSEARLATRGCPVTVEPDMALVACRSCAVARRDRRPRPGITAAPADQLTRAGIPQGSGRATSRFTNCCRPATLRPIAVFCNTAGSATSLALTAPSLTA